MEVSVSQCVLDWANTFSKLHTLNMWSLVGWPFLTSWFQAASKPTSLTHVLALVYVECQIMVAHGHV